MNCDCRLGRKCLEHEYCDVHDFREYSYEQWIGTGKRFVTVRSCKNCDRHGSDVVWLGMRVLA